MKPSGLLVLPNLSPPHHHIDKEFAFLFLFSFFSLFKNLIFGIKEIQGQS